jgi:hypothetical protein
MYTRIWQMTAMMDRKQRGWSISWGKNEMDVPSPSPHEIEFFEDVSDTGKLTRPPAQPEQG